MEILIVLSLIGITTSIILSLNRLLEKVPLVVGKLSYINTQFKYQICLLLISFLVLAVLYLTYPESFLTFFAIGQIKASAQAVPLLGIAEGESWLRIGLSFSFFITLITSGFVLLSFRRSNKGFKYLLPFIGWVLLFSLTNSFAEEVIYRLGIIVPLAGKIQPFWILVISAIAFGLPHFRGMPNGLIGVLLAGFLGWLLAKSVVETQGIFWAWGIHFLQDVVIFSAFVLGDIWKRHSYNHTLE